MRTVASIPFNIDMSDLGPRAPGIVLVTAPILCTIEGCKRAGPNAIPFLTLAARGSHRRRVHGIVSLAMSSKRPDGGLLKCPHPECANRKPYVSISGRETHLRVHHGAKMSMNPEAIRKRRDRQLQRLIAAQNGKPPFKARPTVPPPKHPATESHVARTRLITPGESEYLRRRLLYVVNATWARELNATPSMIRDEIEQICRNNFAQLPRRRARPQEIDRA